jgi:hypothetical protein
MEKWILAWILARFVDSSVDSSINENGSVSNSFQPFPVQLFQLQPTVMIPGLWSRPSIIEGEINDANMAPRRLSHRKLDSKRRKFVSNLMQWLLHKRCVVIE